MFVLVLFFVGLCAQTTLLAETFFLVLHTLKITCDFVRVRTYSNRVTHR